MIHPLQKISIAVLLFVMKSEVSGIRKEGEKGNPKNDKE